MQHLRIYLVALSLGCAPLTGALAWGNMGPMIAPAPMAPSAPPARASAPPVYGAPVTAMPPPTVTVFGQVAPAMPTPSVNIDPGSVPVPGAAPLTEAQKQALITTNQTLSTDYWSVKAQVDTTNDLADLVVKPGFAPTQAQTQILSAVATTLQANGNPTPSAADVRFALQQQSIQLNDKMHTINQNYINNQRMINTK